MPVSPARHFKCLVSTNFTTRADEFGANSRSGYNVCALPSHPYVSSCVSRCARVAVGTDEPQVCDVVVVAMTVDAIQFERNMTAEPFCKTAHRTSGFEQVLG